MVNEALHMIHHRQLLYEPAAALSWAADSGGHLPCSIYRPSSILIHLLTCHTVWIQVKGLLLRSLEIM